MQGHSTPSNVISAERLHAERLTRELRDALHRMVPLADALTRIHDSHSYLWEGYLTFEVMLEKRFPGMFESPAQVGLLLAMGHDENVGPWLTKWMDERAAEEKK